MKDIQSVYSISSVSTAKLILPCFIQSKVCSIGFSYAAFASNVTLSGGEFFSEILFLYCVPQKSWRFMGVSVNYIEKKSRGEIHLEELASSIFRTSPTEEIHPPWPCIFAFCETALCSKMGRVVSPFVRLVQNQDSQESILVPLREFDYQTMTWSHDVSPFSIPA
ncbi:MAG: hypothetical protein CL916_02695 [Deltaproteobacteria bacterium]|nr:hypothetical protein [Deltaproteobacteria bacterium]